MYCYLICTQPSGKWTIQPEALNNVCYKPQIFKAERTYYAFHQTRTNPTPSEFLHPCSDKLNHLLHWAQPPKSTSDVKILQDEVSRACVEFQRFPAPSYSFCLSLLPDQVTVSHEMDNDLLSVEGRSGLHVICTHIHFRNGGLLKSKSPTDI